MLLYLTLFIGLLYFKLFRVRRQQEQLSLWNKLEGTVTLLLLFGVIVFGFMIENWYSMLAGVVVSAVIVSLMITTVQLGIFIDGKPLFKLSALYRLMPLLALLSIIGGLWTISQYYLG